MDMIVNQLIMKNNPDDPVILSKQTVSQAA